MCVSVCMCLRPWSEQMGPNLLHFGWFLWSIWWPPIDGCSTDSCTRKMKTKRPFFCIYFLFRSTHTHTRMRCIYVKTLKSDWLRERLWLVCGVFVCVYLWNRLNTITVSNWRQHSTVNTQQYLNLESFVEKIRKENRNNKCTFVQRTNDTNLSSPHLSRRCV